MKNILLYGDSNTWGFNPDFTSKSDLRFAREERWGGVLQECLGPECCVLEEGLSGRTTSLEDPAAPGRSGLALLAPIVQSHQPLDLLVFLLGTNDMKNTYHASVADIRRGMELVLQAALCPYAWDTRKPPKMLLISPTYSELAGGDPCFALEIPLTLRAGEEKEINIFLGAAMTRDEIRRSVARCREAGFAERSFQALKTHWEHYFEHFHCRVPDENAMTMANIWNPYQAERNFLFSRNLSYYATGTFRGVGFRDTAQDVLSMIPFHTGRAREKLDLLLSQEYRDGHTNHYFFPIEGYEPVTRIHSDNHLWVVMAVYALVMEEGKLDYLKRDIPFYDGEKASVWEHLKRSIDFVYQNIGTHGLPLMLHSDWNDMLYKVCREGRGESVMVAFMLGLALRQMAELAELMGEENDYLARYEAMKETVNRVAWDGEWYARATMDDGRFLGVKREPMAKIWLNAQTWAVLSGMAPAQRAHQAMDSVRRYLNTPLGIKKIDPAMADYPTPEDPLTYYNKGCGENGSVFCHANAWAVIAECLLGRGERAWEYYSQLLPMNAQAKAGEWRYKAEPYVYSSNIFGPESDKFGLANVSWLTGTAAWMYVAFTQYLLGVKPVWGGLSIEPCLPPQWESIEITRIFRGCRYHIRVKNGEKLFIPHEEGRTHYERTDDTTI